MRVFENQCKEVRAGYHPLTVKGLDYDSRNRLLAGSICVSLGIIRRADDMKENIKLPARFETVRKRPLVIIDGAHNPSKIESTVHNLSQLKYRNLILVIAVSADKDWKSMMKIIVPNAHQIYVTRFSVPGRQAVDPKLLLEDARKHVGERFIHLYSDPFQAYRNALKSLVPTDLLLVTGSFYLAGDIRSLYCSEEKILGNRNSRLK